MNGTDLAIRSTRLALVAIGFLIASGPVIAQEAKEVTVVAPEVVHHRIGRTAIGGTIELITLTHRVSYADLDLSKHSGAAMLETRINDAAKTGCKQLHSLYPLDPEDPDCVKKAADGGMEQAKAAIAAASK